MLSVARKGSFLSWPLNHSPSSLVGLALHTWYLHFRIFQLDLQKEAVPIEISLKA